MCRARPGPRCSYDARKRQAKAEHNFAILEDMRRTAESGGRQLTKRRRLRYELAVRRLEASQRVFWSTPEGQRSLEEQIGSAKEVLTNEFNNRRPRRSNPRHSEYLELQSVVERNGIAKEEALTHRQNSLRDMQLVRPEERRSLRQQATARGGKIGSNAHPISEVSAQRMRDMGEVESSRLSLREWNADDVARASSWVEHGGDPGFVENPRLRPVKSVRDNDGQMIDVGSKIEDYTPQSRLIRLNTPDGQVVEGRHDVHLTKNDAGDYVVTIKSTVGSSWEDASPIDVTRQQVGHIISDTTLATTKSKQLVGKTRNKAEALRIARHAMRDFDAPRVTALMGRDRVVNAGKRNGTSLQRRGINVWHRYAPDASDTGVDTDLRD